MVDLTKMDDRNLTKRMLGISKLPELALTAKTLRIFFFLPHQNKTIHSIGRLLILLFLSVPFVLTVTKTIKIMLDLWDSYDPVGKQIIQRTVDLALKLMYYSAVSFCLLGVNYAASPIVVPILLTWVLPENQTFEQSLPLRMECFVDEDKYFYYIFVYHFIVIMVFCWFPIAFNNLQCITIGFIIGTIHYLRYFLKELDIELEQNKEIKNGLIDRKIIQLIRRHQKCISLYQNLNRMGRPIFFYVIVCITFHLVCGGTMMVILMDIDLSGAAKMFIVYTTSIVSVMLICIPSQLLSNAGFELYKDSHSIDLHKYSKKARIHLMIMMMKTKHTLVIQAGPIFELNFKTFSVVLKSSFSFVTTFRSYYASIQE